MTIYKKITGWLSVTAAILFFGLMPVRAADKVSIDLNGVKLNALMQLADGKTAADGVILITHGTLAHNEMEIIAGLQNHLGERGHNTLAINLSLGISDRASAMYDCKVPHRHKYLDAVDEIAAWTDWLKQQGATEITVLGHSRGGGQTARYAAEKRDSAVTKIVLIAPATWSEEETRTGYEKSNGVPLATVYDKAKAMADAGKGSEMMENIGLLYCQGASATADSFLSYYTPDPKFHSPSLLKDISVPVLVIAGTDDKVVEGLQDMVGPMADGEKIIFKLITDADHFFRDFAGEEAADSIDEFLGN